MILREWVNHPNVDSWTTGGTEGGQPWEVAMPKYATILKQVLPPFLCPSNPLPKKDDDGYGASHYVGNMGNEVSPLSSFVCGTPIAASQNGVLLNDGSNTVTRVVRIAEVLDGASNTIMVGEIGKSANVTVSKINHGNFPLWGGGNNDGSCTLLGGHLRLVDVNAYINRKWTGTGTPPGTDYSDFSFGSFHPNGAQFVFVDGSVHFIPQSINTTIYRVLGGRNDGLVGQLP
jgi:prepilin-type processing-associated H-X9-DG protein